MSDYLGPNQTRVLDSTNHGFESITYQLQKPPLSNEFNLMGKIDAERSQKIVQANTPSGWTSVGQFRDDLVPAQCQAGDVLCSSDCSSNSFWLIGQDYGQNTEKNVAFVNGWRVVVQGSASPTGNGYPAYTNNTEDNLIRLPAPPENGSRIDFVFLEVWRKLLTPEDTVYQYGNVDHASPFTNDLIDPARGFETSLRIQLQYRIRVAEIDDIDDIDLYPEGFCPSVYVQGPLSSPISTCSHANFSQVPGDPGLWIAGAGDDVAQETLQTVDGHTYAIPLFAIRRRNTQAFDPRAGHVNGTSKTLADYLNGIPSDRPDGHYNDFIMADDFVDLRHLVGFKKDLGQVCAQAFRFLQANNLKTKMGYTTLGGEQNGAYLLQVDSITDQTSAETWSTRIGSGDGIRRWFANASTDDSVDGTAYPSSDGGLSQVPTLFLEARKIENWPTTMYPIAMKDQDIPVRYGSAAAPVTTSDRGVQHNMLRARGGSYFDMYNFGHQMIYHALGNGTNTITVDKNLSGYDIVGIAEAKTDGTNVQSIVSVTRNASSYSVQLGSVVAVGKDIELTLYTGSKFFDANKQGRGIIDCYQMVELKALETPNGSITTFTLDSGIYPIIALGSYNGNDGTGYAYLENPAGTLWVSQNIVETNVGYPTGTTTTISFSTAPAGPPTYSKVKVPALIRTAIQAGEGYAFFYNYVPYQGILRDTTASGDIEVLGPAITTTAGSGGIFNYTIDVLNVAIDGSEFAYGTDTNWLKTVRSGYLLRYQRYITIKYFKIKNVISDTVLELETKTGITDSVLMSIIAPDLPSKGYPNIIDRFPADDDFNDHLGNSENLYPPYTSALDSLVSGPTLETRVVLRTQDIMDTPAGSVVIGRDASAERGRSMVYLPSGQYGTGALGLTFESVRFDAASVDHYKKTYQSYALNDSGKVRMVVVGSESDNVIPAATTDGTCVFSPFSTKDVVDVFEIPGRPLISDRI
jgi:hypothetical protein